MAVTQWVEVKTAKAVSLSLLEDIEPCSGAPFITAGHGKGGEPSSPAHLPSLNLSVPGVLTEGRSGSRALREVAAGGR